MYKTLLLLMLSASIYVLPFYASLYAWWLIFFFALPLFYTAFTTNISFKEGYFWGFITFLLHMSGVLWGVACMSPTPLLFCVVPFLLCVVYQGIYAGLWFWIMHHLQRVLCIQRATLVHAIIWIVGIWSYFFWIEQYCFICFDNWEGYIFMCPLLPLIEKPWLCALMRFIGKDIIALFIYSWSAFCALLLVHKRYIFFICTMILCCALGYLASYISFNHNKPEWASGILSFPTCITCTTHPLMCAQTLAEELRQLLIRFPQTDIICMPESCILDDTIIPSYAYFFSQQYIGKPIHIIVGSFYKDKENYYNVCYWLYDGNIKARYAKQHIMPLTERIPSLCNFACIEKLYFCDTKQISPATNIKPTFQCLKDRTLTPYICSELFFTVWPKENDNNNPLIVLVNDKWCPALYMRYLMVLVARFKASLWQRDIIYISYSYALLCTADGQCYELQKAF